MHVNVVYVIEYAKEFGPVGVVTKIATECARVIVGHLSTDFISALCEIALNVLRGNIPLPNQQYNQFKGENRHQACR